MLKKTIGAAVLAAIATAPAVVHGQEVKGPKVTWNFSVWGGPRAFTQGIEHVAKSVAAKTGDNFTIKIGYADQLSPARENLDNIKLGAFESAAFCSSYHPGKNPGMTALDLPFLPLDNLNVSQQVYEKFYAHPYIQKEMAKWGAMPYFGGLLPQYEFMGTGEPPKTLEAWKGKRVRALGGLGEAMRILGANPTTVTASEVYTSLDRGTVSAASFPFTYAHASYKLHEISKWYTANLSPGAVNCPIVISQAAWSKLPEQYRKLLMDLKPSAYETLKRAYKAADDKWLPVFKQKLTPVVYSAAELERFQKIGGKPVWDKWVKENSAKGVPGQELVDLILATAKSATK